uniref:HMG box domain-containing protein n=1 Tax=Panagrellus redivivus TaxID=6233 RepID=A0A7E4W2Q1_PANRE
MPDDKLYGFFFAEKAPLLRNLKPYAKSSDADLNKVLDRIWKNYVIKAKTYSHYEVLRSAQLIRGLDTTGYLASLKKAQNEKSEYKIHPQYQYLKEMRDILLRDPLFVQRHLDDMYEILEAGMKMLTPDESKMLAKRAYWDTFMNYDAQKASNLKEDATDDQELPIIIMDDFENHAYNRFQKTLTLMKTVFKTSDVLPQWSQLSEEDRQPYYQEARLCVIAHRAYTLFWNEASNGYMQNFDETNPDKRTVKKTWIEMSLESRQTYFDKAKENVLTDTVNGRNGMGELYRKDEDKISDPAELEFVYPREILEFKNNGFAIFVNHKRPELLKEPGMKEKQYFYLNLVLRDRWNTLSIEECQEYESIANSMKKADEETAKKESSKPLLIKKLKSSVPKPDNRICAPKLLTDEADYDAFLEYSQTTKEAGFTELTEAELWQKWIELSPEEQENYYGRVLSDQAFLLYKKDFGHVELRQDMSNIVEYELEHAELKKTWDGFAAPTREAYIKQYKENKASEKQKIRENRDSCLVYPPRFFKKSKAVIEKITSRVMLLYPAIITTDIDEEQKAFIAYMEKQRPELLKEPGMDKKRHFHLSLILQQRWNKLCVTKREEYNQIVRRIMLIHKALADFDRDTQKTLKSLPRWSLYNIEMIERSQLQVLRQFDDVDEYYSWMPDGKRRIPINDKIPEVQLPLGSNRVIPNSFMRMNRFLASAPITDSEPNPVRLSAPPPSKPWHFDMSCFTDKTDLEAFNQFKAEVQSMTATNLSNEWLLWEQFVYLEKAQRDSYYDNVQKTKAESKARLLYAKANVVAMQARADNCNYIKKLHELHQEWEKLNAATKNSYLDTHKKMKRLRQA